jgi:hypothetical protein
LDSCEFLSSLDVETKRPAGHLIAGRAVSAVLCDVVVGGLPNPDARRASARHFGKYAGDQRDQEERPAHCDEQRAGGAKAEDPHRCGAARRPQMELIHAATWFS